MPAANRRDFLKSSSLVGAALAGGYFPGLSAAAAESASPNEQPVFAFIGCGIRYHTYHINQAMRYGPCAAVCDVDAIQAGRALQAAFDQHRKHNRPLVVATHDDYRRTLDRKDIDAVCIGAVDHWHTKIAIDAMRAGKDVYCEKPVTLTIREGQQILKVQQETGRVIQVGTQQRTEFAKRFAQAAAMVRDGRVGKMQEVTVAIGGSRVCDPLPEVTPPAHLNWERWLGQAPLTPYIAAAEITDKTGWGAGFPFSRTHRYYRWFYEYSGGKLTDWGAHHVDVAMWALDKLDDDCGQMRIDPLEVEHPVPFVDGMPTVNNRFNCATKFKVKVTFDDGVVMWVRDSADDLGFGNGVMFQGDQGRFLVNRGKLVGKPVEDLKDNPLPDDALNKLYGGEVPRGYGDTDDGAHMKNFVDCLKSRRAPASDMQSHHRMLNVCHAINIALRLNRPITYDSRSESIVGDQQANAFVERQQRKGYEITA